MKLISQSGMTVTVSKEKGVSLLASGGFKLPEQEKSTPKRETRKSTTRNKKSTSPEK